MKLLEVELPNRVIIGKKALDKVGDLCKDLGLKGSATIFTGQNTIEIAAKKVSEILESYDYKTSLEIINVNASNTKLNSDFTVGVGGGKAIDAAKIAAKHNGIPFISIPTAMSHDGIASNRAVVNETYSIPAVMPTGIIIDTDIILKSPYRLTASGCGDTIAKLTAVEDWKLANREKGEYISEYAANINKTSADLIIKSAKSIRKLEDRGLRNLIEALVFSGISMSIAGSSRPASGSEHLFSHALNVLYPNKTSLHGEECGVGTILCSYLHEMDWERIVKALKIIGAPTNNEELGIPKGLLVKALFKAKDIRNDRFTILNYKKIDIKKAEMIARATGVIQ
jgi:glycerol-1-phosphate dehydrogenase [NAD(P)+]